jgi:hypothetical protein
VYFLVTTSRRAELEFLAGAADLVAHPAAPVSETWAAVASIDMEQRVTVVFHRARGRQQRIARKIALHRV